MILKGILSGTLLAFVVTFTAPAQPPPSLFAHAQEYAVGISGGHWSWDPFVALELSSHSFAQDHLRFRLRGSLHGLEAYKASRRHWATYQVYAAGAVYQARISERGRFYIEAGAFGLIPNRTFSGKKLLIGYYGLTGVEVFVINRPGHNVTFYLAAGPSFIKAYAERLEGSPRYGNGLQYVGGLRYYF